MRVFGLLIALLSFSTFASEGAPIFYRATLPIESTVKLGKTARILTPVVEVGWQLGTIAMTYAATESYAATGLVLVKAGVTSLPTIAGAQLAEMKILAYVKEQAALKPLIGLEGLEQIFLVQSMEGDGRVFTTSAKTRAFVFLQMKPGAAPPKLPSQFGEALPIHLPSQDRLVLRLKMGEVEHAAQWEMSLQDFFERKKLAPGTAGEWRASIRSEARKAAVVNQPGFTPEDVRWLDESLNLKKVPLKIEAFYLDAAGVETKIGTLAEGGAARKLLGITPGGWAKRGLLSLFKKPEFRTLPSRTVSPKSAWFCWQDRLNEVMRARATVGIPRD